MKISVDQAISKATKLALKGERKDAEKIYREVLRHFPANQRALKGLQALSATEGALRAHLQSLRALYNRGQLEALIVHASAILQGYPNAADIHSIVGAANARLGRFEEAASSYDKALQLSPDHVDNYFNRGAALQSLRRFDEALASYDNALRLKPDHAPAISNRGTILLDLGRLDEALACYDMVLRLQRENARAHYNCGNVLQRLRRFDEALARYDEALQLKPNYAAAHHNRGAVLQSLRRFDEALACLDKVLQLNPNSADAHYNRGAALQGLSRFNAALDSFDKALQLKPGSANAHHGRGNVLRNLKRLDDALASFEMARQLKPDSAALLSKVLDVRARMCAWEETIPGALLSELETGGEAASPLEMVALDDDPWRQLIRARAFSKEHCPPTVRRVFRATGRHERLRVGYFSADFYDHATMFLMARMLELHDKSKFEVHAFSFGTDARDGMRQRLLNSVDQFHDVRALSDSDVAELARAAAIDVAIDLKGYTQDGRPAIFAHRPAPVQISYLGFPGSMGAEFMDYIIADHVVLPQRFQRFYDEKVIYLPHSYQANDNMRVISDRPLGRSQFGLPERGFVFCCFNNNFKISPAEFDVWMRLIGAVDGSVLWLLKDNEWVESNLRKQASARGVEPNRLVFAERIPLADHLARHRCADLFLDTFKYNAHTTASDALWAGLPVVTKLGNSFAARVAGSLLNAIGMPELATDTVEAYEQLALRLATDPDRLGAVRTKLAANRLITPLFDSERFTRAIERAYELAARRYADGLAPDHIQID